MFYHISQVNYYLMFLVHVIILFTMQHVTAELTVLMKQAEDAASNKKVELFLRECLLWSD